MDEQRYLAAVFDRPADAQSLVEDLNRRDFPMDRISVLHRGGGEGDDFLGIAYTNEKERLITWGAHGAFWGALGAVLAGAAGLLVLPGLGSFFVAGPLMEAIAGAAAGAGLMTAGAAASHLTIAFRRMGIPEEELDTLHAAIMAGKTVVVVHQEHGDPDWRAAPGWRRAEKILAIP